MAALCIENHLKDISPYPFGPFLNLFYAFLKIAKIRIKTNSGRNTAKNRPKQQGKTFADCILHKHIQHQSSINWYRWPFCRFFGCLW
jgi:hypothetical protein